MKKDQIFERISYLVENEAHGNLSEFARMIGVNNQTLRYIVKLHRNYPGYDVICKILQTFVWLSPDWLLFGKGEYRRSQDSSSAGIAPEILLHRIEQLAIENNNLQKENELLRQQKKQNGYSLVAESEP